MAQPRTRLVVLSPTQWRRVSDLFAEALELPPTEQERHVRAMASDDPAVVAEVLDLIETDNPLGSVLVHASLDGLAQPNVDHEVEPDNNSQVAPPSTFTFPVGSEIDRFEVRGHIGAGAQAEVYLVADQKPFERDVVLKLFKPIGTAGLATRVEREAAALSALTHANIVRVLKFGHVGSQPYIVMERIPGRTMHEVLATESVSTHRKLRWLEQLCDGLSAVHARHIVHRDLKPSNLMVDGDALCIFDFGIVRTQNSELTHLEQFVVGTPRFMSPEQISGSHLPPGGLDGRSDLFTVGVIAWELWAARPAFTGEDFTAVMGAILFGDGPPPMTSLLTGFDQELSDIIQRALNRRYSDRFQSAAELGTAFRRVRSRLPYDAPEPRITAGHLWETGEHASETVSREDFPPASSEVSAQGDRRRWPIGALLVTALLGLIVFAYRQSMPVETPPTRLAPPPVTSTLGVTPRAESKTASSTDQSMRLAESASLARSVARQLTIAQEARDREGDLNKAEQAYVAALGLDPENVKARAGLEQVRKTRNELIRAQAQTRTEVAQKAIDDGRLEDAKREIEAALRLDANNDKARALATTLENLESLARQR